MNPRLAEIVRVARGDHVGIDVVEVAQLDRVARGGAHQGVAAMLGPARRDAWTPEDLVAAADGAPLLVVLDGIEDPQNVGAILRSVDAAGATGVIRQTRRAAPLEGAAAKASAGAVAHVRIADVVNVARALEALKRSGVWVVGLDGDASAAYDRVDLTLPTALVLGSGGHGPAAPGARALRLGGADSHARARRQPERVGGRRGGAVRGGPPAPACGARARG